MELHWPCIPGRFEQLSGLTHSGTLWGSASAKVSLLYGKNYRFEHIYMERKACH
jgi:hypothetical protein